MKVKREWQDELELFEMVVDALQNSELGDRAMGLDEEGSYGDRGTITIKVGGRKFMVELHEIV